MRYDGSMAKAIPLRTPDGSNHALRRSLHIRYRVDGERELFDLIPSERHGFGWVPRCQRVTFEFADVFDLGRARDRIGGRLFALACMGSYVNVSLRGAEFGSCALEELREAFDLAITASKTEVVRSAPKPARTELHPDWPLVER